MCNAWCLEFVKDTLEFWPESPDILEVGAKDINGTVRPVCEPLANSYIGVDIEEGDGVDALVDAHNLTGYFSMESFDIVISTEMIEHIDDWPNVFYQMMSVLEKDGLLILTTRSIGFEIHDYPDDYWRYSGKDMSLIFERVGEILAVADDMTLGYPCGIGVAVKKRASASELETWKQYLRKSCELYNVNISDRITFENYHSLKALELPFDQYQRYKIIQEALDLLREQEAPLTILDVGGWPGTLRRFLPGDRVVVADLQNTEGVSLRADGCRLPFPDRSFDAVVSSDTFEHIPPCSRPQFLGELVRVTRGPLLLGAPFDDPQVVQVEEILQQLIATRYGERYYFIEEHRKSGLPDLTDTLSLLYEAGFDTVTLPNGYLYRWILGISLWFLLQSRFHDDELSARVNAFYNRSFYRQDNREPSYRKLVVAARESEAALSRLPDALLAPAAHDPAADLMAVQTLNLLVQMLRERWSERALQAEAEVARLTEKHEAEVARLTEKHEAEVARLIQEYEAQLRQPGTEVARLTQKHKAEVARLTRELDTIYSSKTWRIASKGLRAYQLAEAAGRRLVGTLGSIGLFPALRKVRHEPPSLTPHFRSLRTRDLPDLLGPPPTTHDVICFPITNWDFRFQRSQHLCSQFAAHGHRVFYVRVDFMEPDLGKRWDVLPFGLRILADNVFEMQLPGPSLLNVYQSQVDEHTLKQFFLALDLLRRGSGMAEALCLVQLPFWVPLAFQLRERFGWKVLYDCLDEHAGFSTNAPWMVAQEQELIQRSDLVTVTAHKLYEKCRRVNDHCLLLPNAGDFAHFKWLPSNALLAKIPSPIIGYYGAISDWFDAELVAYVARQRPQWSFVLIGYTFGADLTPFKGLSNVHLLGEKPYAELPAYLYWFDVCCIPFKITPLTEATNPVKFYEFMSAGKPVVSVPLPELLPYEEYLYLAADRDGFVRKIEQALQEDDPALVTRRVELGRSNTWEERYQTLKPQIEALYGKASTRR